MYFLENHSPFSELLEVTDSYPTNYSTLAALKNLTAPPPVPPTAPAITAQFAHPAQAELLQIYESADGERTIVSSW